MSTDTHNPRLQCDNCGKWRRLCDAEGNQLSFPLDGRFAEGVPDDISYDNLCVWCHKDLFGIVLPPLKELTPPEVKQ